MERHRVRVIQGKGRGKQLGVPTLNFEIPPTFDVKEGIYAGWVLIESARHKAAIHFGPVPTFQQSAVSLEAHLLDAVLDQPPAVAELEIIKRVSAVEALESPAQLKEKIEKDIALVRQILDYKNDTP